MAAAMLTKTLRVGSMVFDNDYRHPVLLGKEVATLDVLSGGRFELGLGAGKNLISSYFLLLNSKYTTPNTSKPMAGSQSQSKKAT